VPEGRRNASASGSVPAVARQLTVLRSSPGGDP
jgi:hypothetical protein